MVRAALSPLRSRRKQEPPRFAAYVRGSVGAAHRCLRRLPIISAQGWYPDFGFLMLIGWRLLRSDPLPALVGGAAGPRQ